MSKASEWKRNHDIRPNTRLPSGARVCVDDSGCIDLDGKMVSSRDGLALAAWIIDTFGEPATPAGEVQG